MAFLNHAGASHGYFGHEDWAAYAPGLKSIEDATAIPSPILAAFEQGEATDDPGSARGLTDVSGLWGGANWRRAGGGHCRTGAARHGQGVPRV